MIYNSSCLISEISLNHIQLIGRNKTFYLLTSGNSIFFFENLWKHLTRNDRLILVDENFFSFYSIILAIESILPLGPIMFKLFYTLRERLYIRYSCYKVSRKK